MKVKYKSVKIRVLLQQHNETLISYNQRLTKVRVGGQDLFARVTERQKKLKSLPKEVCYVKIMTQVGKEWDSEICS